MIKLVLADDHHLFREGIESFFENAQEIQVVGSVENGKEVLDLINSQEVDVLVMDISMPIMSGIEVAEKLADRERPKVIMLSMHDTQDYIQKMLSLKVDGYLLKSTNKNELTTAIQHVHEGKKYFAAEVQQSVMENLSSEKVATPIKLTRREKEILQLICEELNTSEIAEKLFISTYTVETHRKNLLSKTGSKNMAGLVKFALQNKFL